VRFICDDILIFEKINLNSIAAFMGNAQALQISTEKFDILGSIDNATLVETCMRTNDTECLSILLSKMNKQHLFLN